MPRRAFSRRASSRYRDGALDQADPAFYKQLPVNASHYDIARYELARLDIDHAAIGAMMLTHWQLPRYLCEAIRKSHESDGATKLEPFVRAMQLGASAADIFLQGASPDGLAHLCSMAQTTMGITREQVGELIDVVVRHSAELAQLFDIFLSSAGESRLLMDRAGFIIASKPSVHRADLRPQGEDAHTRKAHRNAGDSQPSRRTHRGLHPQLSRRSARTGVRRGQ